MCPWQTAPAWEPPELRSLAFHCMKMSVQDLRLDCVCILSQVKPSVLHGDLWSGNISGVDGEPSIFDPAGKHFAVGDVPLAPMQPAVQQGNSLVLAALCQLCANNRLVVLLPLARCWRASFIAVPPHCLLVVAAVYYGHSEADFGMSWCAGFSDAFYRCEKRDIQQHMQVLGQYAGQHVCTRPNHVRLRGQLIYLQGLF